MFYNNNEYDTTAIAYIAHDPSWVIPPSEQYLTAIHVMLREQWSHQFSEITIPVKGIFRNEIVTLFDWSHPGTHNLTLPSLCVEANTRLPIHMDRWIMPKTIIDIQNKLKLIDIHSTAQLAIYLSSAEGMKSLNQKLMEKNIEIFDIHVLHVFKELLCI